MELINTPYYLNEEHKHTSKVLNFEKVNIVNMQLQLGETVAEHDVDADVLIIVKTGKVAFMVAGEEVEVSPQNVLHMNPGERHSLRAMEVSDFLVLQIKRA
jgi:quercetin dioxygenase-like cupin family protein